MRTVLLIDDEIKLRTLLSRILKSEGFEVLLASDCKSAVRKLEQNEIDVVLCDVRLPDGDGVDLTRRVKAQFPQSEVIVFTAFGNVSDGIRAMKNGAFDYLVKGDDNEKIVPLVYRAMEKSSLQKRVSQLENRVRQTFSFSSIIGSSKKIHQALELAHKVAATDTTVLLLGETGTGKEVFAQAIHEASNRSRHSFVALNCSAFGRDILESELFGHRAGAFTGAVSDKRGLLEEADGGTLFLDEIAEMPLELQAKLLRVLETSEFFRVGDTKTTVVNFRLIAATNRDLKAESDEHRFRSDLYYRLNVFEITLPSLADRVDDIEALAQHFISVFCMKTNKKQKHMPAHFLRQLQMHHWPGNIRELKNVIERSVILSDAEELGIDCLPLELRSTTTAPSTILSAFELASVEKLHIQKVLNYTGGNKAETARLLNIGLTTLYRKLDEYKVS